MPHTSSPASHVQVAMPCHCLISTLNTLELEDASSLDVFLGGMRCELQVSDLGAELLSVQYKATVRIARELSAPAARSQAWQGMTLQGPAPGPKTGATLNFSSRSGQSAYLKGRSQTRLLG